MTPNKPSDNQKILLLAAVSAVMSVVFNIMSAPFIRVLAATKSKVFWLVGIVFIPALFFLQMNLVAIYAGAIWMTLGLYSELEKKGISWKKSSALSVFAGALFGVLSYLALARWSHDPTLANEITEPLTTSLKQVLPDENFETKAVIIYMPGLLAAALISALAVSLAFEAPIFHAFKLKREKLASGLRWLEFRLPDLFIWTSLFSFLFSIVETTKYLQIVAINFSVAAIVAFFFQGLSVFEFATRMYQVGRLSKLLLYALIIFWALPFVAIIGIADYWVDFRRRMRKRIKAN